MPFSSDKQRRYMNWAASKGKIKKSIVEEYNETSKGMKLPETVEKFKKLKNKMKKGN